MIIESVTMVYFDRLYMYIYQLVRIDILVNVGQSYHTETVARSPKGQVKLVLLWGFAECGNRKALRLRAQGVYSCK